MTTIEAANEVLEAARHATPIPWEVGRGVRDDSVFVASGGGDKQSADDGLLGVGGLVCEGSMRDCDRRNMQYIVSAANHAPTLAKAYLANEAKLKRLAEYAKEMERSGAGDGYVSICGEKILKILGGGDE